MRANDRPTEGQTDWQRLQEMSDAEAERNAEADLENPPLSSEFLKKARRVPPLKERLGRQ